MLKDLSASVTADPRPVDAGPTIASAVDENERLRVSVDGLCLANPVIPASGCFGPELAAAAEPGPLEYLIVGAVAVQIGTANFTQPTTMRDIVSSLPAMLTTSAPAPSPTSSAPS